MHPKIWTGGLLGPLAAAALATVMAAGGARADKIKNPIAVFAGLDKITGRIISFEVAMDETVQFGALQITPRICYNRPPTETPNTDAFLEVDEVTFQNEHKRIFGGWMFAGSPGLHAIEHPVYDVWLTDCKGGTEIIAEPREVSPAEQTLKDEAPVAAPAAAAPPAPKPKRQPPPQRPRRVDPEPPLPEAVAPRPAQRSPGGFFENLFRPPADVGGR